MNPFQYGTDYNSVLTNKPTGIGSPAGNKRIYVCHIYVAHLWSLGDLALYNKIIIIIIIKGKSEVERHMSITAAESLCTPLFLSYDVFFSGG